MMRRSFLAAIAVSLSLPAIALAQRPDVVLIAIDDLNDWVGCLGGHPDAKTPNIDRLAARGVLFDNAHCQAPVCNPSRASLMTSLYPESTGIYFLNPGIAASPVARAAKPMTVRFAEEGYAVRGAGKLYHSRENERYIAEYAGGFGGVGPRPKAKIGPFPGHPLWDWGAFPARDAQMPDHRIATWAAQQLDENSEPPLFLAVGFYRPHVPQFAPLRWFQLHGDEVRLPIAPADDLDDISRYARDLTRLEHVAPRHDWVVGQHQWRPLVHSYLACVSFVDAQVGRVLDALDSSARDDSIVVLFSDHGFHLGEKARWAKRSLWEDGVRVPLIIAGGGIRGGRVCSKPVELIDIYPTLLELCGLDADPAHEGHSLAPLLEDVATDWPHVARTCFGPGNVAIRSERYRYVRYRDGSEELYDHATDPHELHNLVEDPGLAAVVAAHREHVPQAPHPVLGQGSTGHQALRAAETARSGR